MCAWPCGRAVALPLDFLGSIPFSGMLSLSFKFKRSRAVFSRYLLVLPQHRLDHHRCLRISLRTSHSCAAPQPPALRPSAKMAPYCREVDGSDGRGSALGDFWRAVVDRGRLSLFRCRLPLTPPSASIPLQPKTRVRRWSTCAWRRGRCACNSWPHCSRTMRRRCSKSSGRFP